MKTKSIKTIQSEPRSWADIEGDFNHVHFSAGAVTGLLDNLANHNNDEPGSIDSHTFCSATYTAHTGVIEMGKHFNELLNLHITLVRSNEKKRADEIEEIKAIAEEFEDEYPQLMKEANEAILNGTSLKEFQCTALHMISQAMHKPKLVKKS